MPFFSPTQQWGAPPALGVFGVWRGSTVLSGLVRLSSWYSGIKFSLRSLSTQPEEAHDFLWVFHLGRLVASVKSVQRVESHVFYYRVTVLLAAVAPGAALLPLGGGAQRPNRRCGVIFRFGRTVIRIRCPR